MQRFARSGFFSFAPAFLAALAASAGACAAPPVAPPGPAAALDADALVEGFSEFLERRLHEDRVPGLSAALFTRGRLLYAAGLGYRDLDRRRPATAETLFHIGSLQKAMTSLIVAELVDEGRIAWDTPAAAITSHFSLRDADATRKVTIRHLLTMTSGIPGHAEDGFVLKGSRPEDVFEHVSRVALIGAPGEKFSYSNLAVALAGSLAVLADGGRFGKLSEGFADELRRRVLVPIGMERARIDASEARRGGNKSRPYRLDAEGRPVAAVSEDLDHDPLAPAGCLKASVLDMALFLRTELGRGVAPNGRRVVSEENLRERWKPGLEGYGMGWQNEEIEGVRLLTHEGSFDHFLGVMGFAPKLGVGFVVLTNCDQAAERLVAECPGEFVRLLLLGKQ